MSYETIIGLEVHVQLKTASKAFCGCGTEFGLAPNTQVCPVCLGFPGTLPVLNRQFLNYGLRVALALNCQPAAFLKFDRKHYFYPDLPKNYQISQYDQPLAANGWIDIDTPQERKRIRIKRVHMEEDAGKLIHTAAATLVDYNRCGMPLLEIVSEPDIASAQQAYDYLVKLKAIIAYLDVSDCDMEKGSLRCDANISLRPCGQQRLGVKTEVKNMNSFKGVRDALNYEAGRQEDILGAGGAIEQQTRLWNETQQKTILMRSKEEAHDYRYFPEPDLVPFTIAPQTIAAAQATLPELPEAKKERLMNQFGLPAYDADVISSDKHLALFFEETAKGYPVPKTVSNWLMGDIMSYCNEHRLDFAQLPEVLPARNLIDLLQRIDQGTISGKIAKTILPELFGSDKTVDRIIAEKNLCQISDTAELNEVIRTVLRENAGVVTEFKSGKEKSFMFLVGQIMKKTRGKANPQLITTLLRERINSET
ncbi:MAG: Asp-tRNA(Asn)/Glu-tRNA(Gln) amidotransferase subunit GatB [Candidatus Omnitrophica bacterium]|nr:Asp-tRNA(Asn)/Glu-tRNA(Gln) amidotransferase subunit GatB [Candidatus Omnitrophota bacterium]